jgi:hypothetical protein
MLVVKFEIWPGGNKNASREIGQLEISNISQHIIEIGSKSDYVCALDMPAASRFTFFVRDHVRSDGLWVLAKRAIELIDKYRHEIEREIDL